MAEETNKWSSKLEFLLSLVGFAVGLGNIWRFPYLCHRNGGGAFLIPYLTSLMLCGIPLFVLEVSASQFSGFGVTKVWNMCPLFKGVGYGMVVLCGVVSAYYSTILTWIIYYLVQSCARVLPWSTCDNDWNTALCWMHRFTNSNNTNGSFPANYSEQTFSGGQLPEALSSNVSGLVNATSSNDAISDWRTPAEEFWHNEALQLSSGIEHLGSLRWDLVGYMALAWIAVFCFICKGAKSIGKVVYVTATVPYALLAILLVRGLLLPGSYIGVKYYLIPDWKKLLEFKVWAEASLQVLYSIGPSFGPLFVMASYNKFHNNCIRDAVVVSLVGCMTSFLAGFVIFSVMGFMAFETGQTVDDVIASGPGLVFIAYPEALSRMPISPLWAVLFFIMLFIVGIDSQMAMVETVIDGLTNIYPNKFKDKKRILFIGILCLIFFLIGLLFCTQAGMYILLLCDWYVVGVSVTIASIVEGVSVYWIYGHRRFYYDMELMVGHKPCIWWKICWGFVSPAILLVMTVYNLLALSEPYYGKYTYPSWAIVIGWIIAISSFIPIPTCIVICLLKQEGSLGERLKKSLRPAKVWGPSDQKVWKVYDYDVTKSSPDCSRLFQSCCQTNQSYNVKEKVALNQV